MLFHDLLLPDGILGTEDGGIGPDFGAMGFLKMIYFFPPQTVTLAQMVSLNDEPRAFSILFRHCENLSAAVSSTFCSVYPRECVRKFRMKTEVWHLTCIKPRPSEMAL